MPAAGAMGVDMRRGLAPGRRSTGTALAVSVGLHVVVAAAAVWWPSASRFSPPSAATVEVHFWPVPEPAVPAAPPELASEMELGTAASPPEAPPVAEQAPPEPAPLDTAAVPEVESEPEPPPAVEQPIILFKTPPPPPPRPRRREAAIAPRPVAAVSRQPVKPVEPPPQPRERSSAAAGPDIPTAAPPLQAAAAAAPAVPTTAAVASDIAAAAPVITTARFRSPPTPPVYPRRAVDLQQEGEVIVRALVGPDGESREIRVHRSSGVGLLDDAALRAVRRWSFEAARINGRSIEAWVEVPVRFQLRSVL